jgi:four helix bundle protein
VIDRRHTTSLHDYNMVFLFVNRVVQVNISLILNVYQESIRFITWISELLETIPKNLSVHNQLDRASTSIPLNIAEGNGKHTSPDRCRYFDIARGSALECAACLDVLVAKKKIDEDKERGINNCYIWTARKLPRLNDQKRPNIIIWGRF